MILNDQSTCVSNNGAHSSGNGTVSITLRQFPKLAIHVTQKLVADTNAGMPCTLLHVLPGRKAML